MNMTVHSSPTMLISISYSYLLPPMVNSTPKILPSSHRLVRMKSIKIIGFVEFRAVVFLSARELCSLFLLAIFSRET